MAKYERKKKKHGRQGEGGGRPSKKNSLDLGMIETLYGFGLIDEQVAKLLGVSVDALDNWKKDEKFLRALKAGKVIADNRVERALYERATGYSHPEDHISVYDGVATITPTIKHYPPDPTSMIFWLKNRRRQAWRDKQDIEFPDKDGNPQPVGAVFGDTERSARLLFLLEQAEQRAKQARKGGKK